MKLDLVLTRNTRTKAPRTPVEVFKQCPSCRSKDLIPIDGDVLCGRCSWDSLKLSVDAGLMDKMFTRAVRPIEHGGDQEIGQSSPSADEAVISA